MSIFIPPAASIAIVDVGGFYSVPKQVENALQSLGQHLPRVVTLTDAANIAVDASLADNFRVTLGGNRTLSNPTNLTSGQVINFRILQDGTGNRTLAFGNKYKFPGGVAPTLSTGANAIDFISCQYDSTDDTLLCVTNFTFG